MSDAITGSCWCGKVRVSSPGPAKFAIICHCSDCRKVSGAGGLPQLAVPRDGVRVSGPVHRFHTTAPSGNALTFGFCENCGSSIYKETEAGPTLSFLCLGVLDQPGEVPPLRPVYTEGRPEWDRVPDGDKSDS